MDIRGFVEDMKGSGVLSGMDFPLIFVLREKKKEKLTKDEFYKKVVKHRKEREKKREGEYLGYLGEQRGKMKG